MNKKLERNLGVLLMKWWIVVLRLAETDAATLQAAKERGLTLLLDSP